MTTKLPVIAIVGATGVVGNEMLKVLEESALPCGEVRLFASEESAGEYFRFRDSEATVEVLSENSFQGVDYALFALRAELASKFAPIAAESGALVVDNSSCFRMDNAVPLIVPEVNPETLLADRYKYSKIIANPNCSTIQLVPILHVIHQLAGLKRVVVSTYQSVSGAGKVALDELWNQTRSIFTQQEVQPEAFQHQIAFNCVPQIDVFLESGYTKEEYKIIEESRKILDLPELRITATAVRVPVFHCHAESVNVETERAISENELTELLRAAEGIEVSETSLDYPLQVSAAGTDQIHVGRIRRDSSVEHGINFWVVADNLRKGAALNAVQVLGLLMERSAE